MSYATFKASVLGKHIGDNECVSLIVNNPSAYSEQLFPGVVWTSIFNPVSGARQLLDAVNTKYYQKVTNDHANAAQLPPQGAVMVFDATPHAGYTNTFNNPYGHTGVCDSATSSGYYLLQQNAPASGQAVNVTFYPWSYRPCLGWLIPIDQTPPAPSMISRTQLDQLYTDLLGRLPDPGAYSHYVGNYNYDFVASDLKNSNEYLAKQAAKTAPKETPSEPTPQPTPEPTPAPVTSNPKGDTPPETPAVPPADSQPTSNPPAAEKPAAPKTPPKVIVPEPHTYFTLGQLTVAIIKRLWGIFFGAK